MTRKSKPREDPVVEEVRRIRATLWKQAGGTVEGYLAQNRRNAKVGRVARADPRAGSRRRSRRKAG
jgi:hypothetical protein